MSEGGTYRFGRFRMKFVHNPVPPDPRTPQDKHREGLLRANVNLAQELARAKEDYIERINQATRDFAEERHRLNEEYGPLLPPVPPLTCPRCGQRTIESACPDISPHETLPHVYYRSYWCRNCSKVFVVEHDATSGGWRVMPEHKPDGEGEEGHE